jgi:hypothetical protein
MRGAFAHDLRHGGVQWMLRIGAIEPLITITAAHDQIRRFQLRQLILNRSECEKTQSRQLPRIQLLAWVCEQKPQHLRAHHRKQSMQQRLFHYPIRILECLKHSSLICGPDAWRDGVHDHSNPSPENIASVPASVQAGALRILHPCHPFSPRMLKAFKHVQSGSRRVFACGGDFGRGRRPAAQSPVSSLIVSGLRCINPDELGLHRDSSPFKILECFKHSRLSCGWTFSLWICGCAAAARSACAPSHAKTRSPQQQLRIT